ncbi:MAG: hypothetical protein PVH40_06005, partial [Gemmatimonadales bacterium]
MSKRQRPSLNLELMPSDVPGTVAHHVARWGLLVILALLTYWAFPIARGAVELPLLDVGEISPNEIIAPFDFYVRKTAEEVSAEQNMLAGQVRPVYEFDAEAVQAVLTRADSLFDRLSAADSVPALIEAAAASGVLLTRDQAEYLFGNGRIGAMRSAVRQLLRRELERGVATTDALEGELHNEVIVRRGGSERVAQRDTLHSWQRVLDNRFASHPDPDSSVGDLVFTLLLNELFRPTLVRNTAEFERRQEEQRSRVNLVKDSVRQDERIIDANEPVTPRAADRLSALRAEMTREGLAQGSFRSTLGQVLTNGLLLSVFWILLLLYRSDIYNTLR